MRFLITGGCGFIGVNLIRRLLDSGSEVCVVDDLSAGKFEYLQDVAPQVRIAARQSCRRNGQKGPWFIQGDIRDSCLVEEAAAGVDAIVHLAAHTRVIDSINQPLHDMEVNIQGTLNLLEAARKHGVKRFIFASSGAALGEQSPPIDEERVPRPAAPYGAAKLAGEGYCSAFYRSFGLETVALRFSNVYGPRSFHKGSVIAHFIKQLLHGNPLEIYGDGTQTRDFLFIHDLTDAICASLSPASNGIAGEVFQIASGRETTVLEIAQMIQDHAGRVGLRSEVIFKPSRKGEVYRNYATIEKAGRLLHYAPKTSLTEGLAATWDWFWTSWQGSRP